MPAPDTAAEPGKPGTGAVGCAEDVVRGAAGPGYAGEWGLFCDYTTATDQPALPTTMAALTGFLAAAPARPATVARRVRAIAAAHRRAGYLLTRPEHGPAAPRAARARRRTDPGLMIAACATRGWPAGFSGRRDAFLIVATEVLGYPHAAARDLRPTEITFPASEPDGETVLRIEGRAVSAGDDPRTCPACAVVRWLDILGVADGLAAARRAWPWLLFMHRLRPARTSTSPASPRGGAARRSCCPRSIGTAGSTTTARSPPAPSAPDWPRLPGEPAPTVSWANRPTSHPQRQTRPRRPPQPPVLPGPPPNWTRC